MSAQDFKGLSGEVVVGLLSPATIISAVPVLLTYVVAGLIIGFLIPQSLSYLGALLLLGVNAMVIARFAIPAARGHLDAGFFNPHVDGSETLSFALRYLALTIAWGIPAGLLAWLAFSIGGGMPMGPMGFSPAQMGFSGLLLALAFLIALLAPTLSVIVCAGTDDLRGAFDIDLWRQLLSDEIPSLVVFYATLFGGFAVFWLVYGVPLLLVVVLFSAIADALGAIVGGLVAALPAALMPILIGRMAGALVAGAQDHGEWDEEPPPVADLSSRNGGDDAPPEAADPAPAESAPPPEAAAPAEPQPADTAAQEKLLKKVAGIPGLQLANTILLTGNRLKARPADPLVAAEWVLLRCRANDREEIEGPATKALRLNLMVDNRLLAGKLFADLGSTRNRVELLPDECRKLAEILASMHGYLGAAFCIAKAARSAENSDEAEEELLRLARAARERGKSKDVAGIAKLFAQAYPDSPRRAEVDELAAG